MIRRLALILLPVVLLGFASCTTTTPEPVSPSRTTDFGTIQLQPTVAGVPLSAESAAVFPANAPSIMAKSAIMIDARTGQTLYYKNPDQPRPVASTQKLVTALVLLDNGLLDQPVTVSTADTLVEPSRLNIKAGEVYPRRQLLTAMMVKSSNDAAACLARTSAGSVRYFAALMNAKAAQLGAYHSHFVNPHGLTAPGQFSTARDMAKIAYAAYRQPLLRGMMRLQSYAFRFNSGRVTNLEATNKLLARSSIYTGMKTGYTTASGRCLVTSATLGGREVIFVQLGSDTRHIFNDAEKMVQWQGQGRYFATANY